MQESVNRHSLPSSDKNIGGYFVKRKNYYSYPQRPVHAGYQSNCLS